VPRTFPAHRTCPSLFGRSLGTEAAWLILGYAFDTVGVHRIELEVYAFNPRARPVYEKLGFVHEGTRRQAPHWDGEWVDAHVMAMLAPNSRPAGRSGPATGPG
jgi:RimJ/RimL family protein N-acetyltransferase